MKVKKYFIYILIAMVKKIKYTIWDSNYYAIWVSLSIR